MPQSPFQVDQLQIEPGSGQSLLIQRDVAAGALKFVDTQIPGGITLKGLSGLKNVNGVLIVGKSGSGAAYTTIQSALDAVPSNSSETNPYVILVCPGEYKENLTVYRDGVWLVGLGLVVLKTLTHDTPNTNPAHTVEIKTNSGTTPKKVILQDLTIVGVHDNYACVKVTGGAASQVGSSWIELVNCNLQAAATNGSRGIHTTSVGKVRMRGGSFTGSNALALTLVKETAEFVLDGVLDVTGLQLDYDSAGTLPSLVGSAYVVSGCPTIASGSTLNPPVSSTLTGAGSLTIISCGQVANMTLSGNRSVTILGSNLGNVTLNSTVALKLRGSSHGTMTGATATYDDSVQRGSVTLTSETTKAITFPVPQPDTNYTVSLEVDARPTNDETPWVTPKTTSGFTVNFQTVQTLNVRWSVVRE